MSFSLSMLSTPTVQQHEKFADVSYNKIKTCHDMLMSVSVSLNVKMSQHTTFPTKFSIYSDESWNWEQQCWNGRPAPFSRTGRKGTNITSS